MFKVDTGAQANIISDKLFRSVSLANSTLEKTGVKDIQYFAKYFSFLQA
jgi:hypothetical protein